MSDVLLEVPLVSLAADTRAWLDAGTSLPPHVVLLPEDMSLTDTLVSFIGGPLVLLLAGGALKHCVDVVRLRKNVVMEGVGTLILVALVCVGAGYVAEAWRARQAVTSEGAALRHPAGCGLARHEPPTRAREHHLTARAGRGPHGVRARAATHDTTTRASCIRPGRLAPFDTSTRLGRRCGDTYRCLAGRRDHPSGVALNRIRSR